MSKNAMYDAIQAQVQIIETNSDAWEKRYNALINIQKIFSDLTPSDMENVNADVLRLLKAPLKASILDLRSQIVREGCSAISIISEALGDKMEILAKYLFPILIEGRGSGNKVCASYCDDCTKSVIKHTVTRRILGTLTELAKTSKNKEIRESCIVYIQLVIEHWENQLDKKNIDDIADAIKVAVDDASSSTREQARICFHLFQSKWVNKGEKLLRACEMRTQKLLTSKTLQPSPSTSSSENLLWPTSVEQSIAIGDEVIVVNKGLIGAVRYIGTTQFCTGVSYGLELKVPQGESDGSVAGHYYFFCEPSYGLFVKENEIQLLLSQQSTTSLGTPNRQFQMSSIPSPINNNTSPHKMYNASPQLLSTIESISESEEPLRELEEEALTIHRIYLNETLELAKQEMEELSTFENRKSTSTSRKDILDYINSMKSTIQKQSSFWSTFENSLAALEQKLDNIDSKT